MTLTTFLRSFIEIASTCFNLTCFFSTREMIVLSNESIFLMKHLMIRVFQRVNKSYLK
jgi:hypothetical protein